MLDTEVDEMTPRIIPSRTLSIIQGHQLTEDSAVRGTQGHSIEGAVGLRGPWLKLWVGDGILLPQPFCRHP